MNQVEMAEYLEFETQVYRRIEGGGRAMTFDEAIYVSRKLKVPLDELIEDSAAIFIQEPENTISEALVELVRRVPQHTAAPVLGILQAIVDEKK
ncbi:MAG: helix-turn-helix transcriptional regulator [Pseudomonadales bacterium]